MSKSLYHSELVKESPVTLKVLSDVLNSKYPDKPPYVKVQYNGEERLLQCEDTTEDALDGYKNSWVEITASGSARDGAAQWDVVEVDEPEQRGRRQPARQERREEPRQRREETRAEEQPPRKKREEITDEDRIKELKGAWIQARKFGNLLVLCTEEARRVVDTIEQRSGEPTGFGSDEIQKLAVTIAIHCGQRVNVDRLPHELPPLKARTEPAPERKPAPRKEPEQPAAPDEIEDPEIPF